METRALNQAVRRNMDRFPDDFVCSLTRDEITNLSQFVISSGQKIKHAPNVFVFTEQGIAMLSSVLRGKRAVQVNIAIMRAFVKLRELVVSNKEPAKRLDALEKKYDMQFKVVFDAMRQLVETPAPKEKKIGFIVRERRAEYRTARKKAT